MEISERASTPPGGRAPLGDPPPAPPLAAQQPPPEIARGAVSTGPGGEPDPSPLPSRSPSPPVAALLSSHRRTGRTPESAAPPPPRFFFLSLLWDLAAGAWRGSEREERGTEVQASAAARERSWGTASPASPPGSRRSGWDVTKGSPQRRPPSLEGAPESARRGVVGVPDWSPFARNAAGRERRGAPGSRSQLPLFRKSAGDHLSGAPHNSGASSEQLDPVPLPADSPRVGGSACPPACAPRGPSFLAPVPIPHAWALSPAAPGSRSAPRPYEQRAGRSFLSAGAAAVQTAPWVPSIGPS